MSNIDDAISLYQSGVPMSKVLEQIPVSRDTMYKALRRHGVPRVGNTPPRRLRPEGWKTLVSEYVNGSLSMKKLAARCGVARPTVGKWLEADGIEIRGRSDAARFKWASMSDSQRSAQVVAAHSTRRGQMDSDAYLEKKAIGRQRRCVGATLEEGELAEQLRRLGAEVTQQKAIGKYNVDIAVHRPAVAVELFGGRWHSTGKHARTFLPRSKKILSSGFGLIIIWSVRKQTLDIRRASEAIIRILNRPGWQQSATGRYQVILGDGQRCPAREGYFNDPATIESLGCAIDPRD